MLIYTNTFSLRRSYSLVPSINKHSFKREKMSTTVKRIRNNLVANKSFLALKSFGKYIVSGHRGGDKLKIEKVRYLFFDSLTIMLIMTR